MYSLTNYILNYIFLTKIKNTVGRNLRKITTN